MMDLLDQMGSSRLDSWRRASVLHFLVEKWWKRSSTDRECSTLSFANWPSTHGPLVFHAGQFVGWKMMDFRPDLSHKSSLGQKAHWSVIFASKNDGKRRKKTVSLTTRLPLTLSCRFYRRSCFLTFEKVQSSPFRLGPRTQTARLKLIEWMYTNAMKPANRSPNSSFHFKSQSLKRGFGRQNECYWCFHLSNNTAAVLETLGTWMSGIGSIWTWKLSPERNVPIFVSNQMIWKFQNRVCAIFHMVHHILELHSASDKHWEWNMWLTGLVGPSRRKAPLMTWRKQPKFRRTINGGGLWECALRVAFMDVSADERPCRSPVSHVSNIRGNDQRTA